METPGDYIRQHAEEVRLTEAAKHDRIAQASQLTRAIAQAQACRIEERRIGVGALCSQFLSWAPEYQVPYNSPSPFANGWLLGLREGGPSVTVGYGDVQDISSSKYSLVVSGTGSIKELMVVNACRRGRRRNRLFARQADLGLYSVESVAESIAKLSAKYRAP